MTEDFNFDLLLSGQALWTDSNPHIANFFCSGPASVFLNEPLFVELERCTLPPLTVTNGNDLRLIPARLDAPNAVIRSFLDRATDGGDGSAGLSGRHGESPGASGEPGTDGESGLSGENGSDSDLIVVAADVFSGQLTITNSGQDGGDGGRGGNGGNGAQGTSAQSRFFDCRRGPEGGDGGSGGVGGSGGNGGAGGAAGTVIMQIESFGLGSAISIRSLGGVPGTAGSGGFAG